MSIFLQSQSGIWLNTPNRQLGIHSGNELRLAQNDDSWRFVSSAFSYHSDMYATDSSFPIGPSSQTGFKHTANGQWQRCHSRTLYTNTKLAITTAILSQYYFAAHRDDPNFKLTALDVGCSFQMLRRSLSQKVQNLRYVGLDSAPENCPDILCDASSSDAAKIFRTVEPNVVVALDVLPELHDTRIKLRETLLNWVNSMNGKPGLYVFSVPVRYQSDEHTLKLSSEQWLELLNEMFIIEDIQAIGFLSALAHLTKTTLHIKPAGLLMRSLHILKDPLYDCHLLKTTEAALTRAFSRVKMFRRFSHSIVVTARPRTSE